MNRELIYAYTGCPPPRRILNIITILLLACVFSGCSGNSAAQQTESPEKILRDFYDALNNNDKDTADALLSESARVPDPKGGSLISNTVALIQLNEGIAKLIILKVGTPEIKVIEVDGSNVERRSVSIEYEITFNNGKSITSKSPLTYEDGWRVEFVRQVYED